LIISTTIIRDINKYNIVEKTNATDIEEYILSIKLKKFKSDPTTKV